jgi:hypothetical protein
MLHGPRAEPATGGSPDSASQQRGCSPRGKNRVDPGLYKSEAAGLLTVAKFTLEVDFDGSHHAQAYRAIIAKALDDARQTLRSTAQMAGELKTQVVGVPDPVVFGRWKIDL